MNSVLTKSDVALKEKTEEKLRKLHKIFLDNPKIYFKTEVLAQKMRESFFTIRRLVKIMRLRNIGIMPTRQGFILSKYASQRDDVAFMRRINGHHAADCLALMATKEDIKERWSSLVDKKNVIKLLDSFISEEHEILKRDKIMIEYKEISV